MGKKETGKRYEEKAALYLEGKGVVILERNFKCRQGEVDIIGLHGNCLVFVEVKYRRDTACGFPEEAVGPFKQMKICLVSDYYRFRHPEFVQRQVRYDVVAIRGEEIIWYQDAFSYCRRRGSFSW